MLGTNWTGGGRRGCGEVTSIKFVFSLYKRENKHTILWFPPNFIARSPLSSRRRHGDQWFSSARRTAQSIVCPAPSLESRPSLFVFFSGDLIWFRNGCLWVNINSRFHQDFFFLCCLDLSLDVSDLAVASDDLEIYSCFLNSLAKPG